MAIIQNRGTSENNQKSLQGCNGIVSPSQKQYTSEGSFDVGLKKTFQALNPQKHPRQIVTEDILDSHSTNLSVSWHNQYTSVVWFLEKWFWFAVPLWVSRADERANLRLTTKKKYMWPNAQPHCRASPWKGQSWWLLSFDVWPMLVPKILWSMHRSPVCWTLICSIYSYCIIC